MNHNRDKLQVSAVVFSKNEESNIAACLTSLSDFSERIVVDSLSTDRTKAIALECADQVIDFEWSGDYPKKKQWTLENVKFRNKWILFVDADERMQSSLVNELHGLDLNSSEFGGGLIYLDYRFSGKILKFGQHPRKLALLRIGQVNFPVIDDLEAVGVGEIEGHYQPLVKGKVIKLKGRLLHDDNDPFISWINRHARYAQWEAHVGKRSQLNRAIVKSKTPEARVFHMLPFKPVFFFLNSYLFKFGFLDGRAGFDYAFAKAWYYWLISCLMKEAK